MTTGLPCTCPEPNAAILFGDPAPTVEPCHAHPWLYVEHDDGWRMVKTQQMIWDFLREWVAAVERIPGPQVGRPLA